MTSTEPFLHAAEAAAALRARTGVERHDVAVVLGSGWAGALDLLGTTTATFDVRELPGFEAAGVPGHRGVVASVEVDGGRRVLAFGSRTHLYEGHGVRPVAHGVRTAAAAGCRAVVLTNAAGGLDPAWRPGQAVLISDHLNLTGHSPLEGPTFVDLTDLYATRLRGIARRVAAEQGEVWPEAVYAQFRGPQYETPAEVRMAGVLGAGLVGMSTALEAIAARHAGLEVLALSLVTNAAAGVLGEPLSHEEVLQAGRDAADRLGPVLAAIVRAVAGSLPLA